MEAIVQCSIFYSTNPRRKTMAKSNATPTFDPTAVFGQFKLPNVDVEALIKAQQRNFEAVSAANKVAADGVRALAERQAEIVRNTVDQYAAAVRELMTVKDPQAGATKQVEFVATAFEKSLSNARELAEIATKANSETLEVLNKRVTEGLGEIQQIAAKL
ncbi:MAG: phasin family protein [Alphaproteobacteria bacterium]